MAKIGSWSRLKEYFSLLGLNLVVKCRNLIEYTKVVYKYYRNFSFAKIDTSLVLMYLFDNPFSVSKRFFIHRAHSEEFTYGETPLTTFAKIAQETRITPNDTVYELGCGRGRVCFWLNKFIGCKVTGVDLVDDFIVRAKRIQRKLDVKGIEFKVENFLHTDIKNASVVYLYGTCLEDDTIKKLIKHFKGLPSGARVITVSYALSDYTDEKIFETMKRFPASFTWGEGDVYIQVKK
jgi:SAM-dependent methyltransferase